MRTPTPILLGATTTAVAECDLHGAAVWRWVIKAIDLMTAEPPADVAVMRY